MTPLRPSLLPNDALIVQAAEGEDENRLQHHSLGLQETLNLFSGINATKCHKSVGTEQKSTASSLEIAFMSGYSVLCKNVLNSVHP